MSPQTPRSTRTKWIKRECGHNYVYEEEEERGQRYYGIPILFDAYDICPLCYAIGWVEYRLAHDAQDDDAKFSAMLRSKYSREKDLYLFLIQHQVRAEGVEPDPEMLRQFDYVENATDEEKERFALLSTRVKGSL